MNDGEMISGLKNGDEDSFMNMVEIYKKRVISLCYSYAKDYHEAEDLSQEVFISIYKNIDSYRGDCSFSTYIYKVTVSRCLDFKRRRSIKDFLTGFLPMQQTYEESEDLDDKSFIRQCVKSLKEELRLPIILYYYIGLSQNEIAEVLSVSPKTIEGRIYRAKQKLRVKIEEGGYGIWRSQEII